MPLGADALPLEASDLHFRRRQFLHYVRCGRGGGASPRGPPVAAGQIVVIDDDDSTLRALRRLLEEVGLPSVGYELAEQVLATDACEDAACVVSDLKLPGMSGLELLAALRSQNVTSPFILITANDSPGARAEARARGATYLAKPFLGADLLHAIEAATEGSRRP